MKRDTFTEDSQKNQFQESPGQTSTGLNDRIISPDISPSQLLTNLLSVLSSLLQADEGAILQVRDDKKIDVLALYPQSNRQGNGCPTWIVQSAQSISKALLSDNVIIIPMNRPERHQGQPASHHIFMTRINMSHAGQAVAVFLIGIGDQKTVETKSQMLQLSIRLLNLSERWFLQQERPGDLRPFQKAIETLSATNRENGFIRVAMAFCNEMASQWQCERVSLGFLKERYVQLKAMSHTEELSRKMEIVQAIESAMEECLDQDVEVLSPAPEGATYISRAADELSKRYGLLTVLSLPLRRNGEVFAAVTLERPGDKPFTPDEIGTLRLTCELCTARLADLYEHGRWFGATMAIKARNLLSGLVGPEHTSAKAAGILCTAVILFLIFARGEFRIETPFAMEATYQQVIPAPFDGYLKEVKVEVNEPVEADRTVLAMLDTAEHRLRLAAAEAEKAGYLKQASVAMRDGQIAQAQIAQANADKMTAQINLLNYLLSRADIVSPISGFVVKGDLKKQIGAPVKTGDVLFEVSPLESLRAELLVPEDDIFDIQEGQKGQLATASFPGQRINFIVERINPVAEVVNQRNIFKVRVTLLEKQTWLRPGMEGVAKVSAGKRRYVWIWTRKVVNWVRMKLWI